MGSSQGNAERVTVAVGSCRPLLADYFFTKADMYFLSGFYPSIHDEGSSFVSARNWIADFENNFRPSQHTHLDERGHVEEVREVLPWLRLAVETDPSHIDSYGIGAFMLRKSLGHGLIRVIG